MPILRRHCRAAATGLAEARLVWMSAANAPAEQAASQSAEAANALTSSQELEIRAQYVGEVANYLAEQRDGEDGEAFADRVANSLALREVLQDKDAWEKYYEERMERLKEEEAKLRVIVGPKDGERPIPDFTGLTNQHLDIPDTLLDADLNGLFSTANFDDDAFAHLARARAIREFLELEYTRVKNGPTLKAKWDAEYRAWMLRIKEVERHAKAVLELRIVEWERALLEGLTDDPSTAQKASIRTVTFDPSEWLVQTAANTNKGPNGVGEELIALGLGGSENTLTGFADARERLAENDKQMEAADKQVKEAMKAWKDARKAHRRARKATKEATDAWREAGSLNSSAEFTAKDDAEKAETAAKAAMNNAAKVAEQALAVYATVDAIREVTSGGIGAGLVGDGGLRTRLLRTEFNLGKSSDATGTLRTIANRGDIKGFVFGSTEGLYERAALEVDEVIDTRFPNLEQRTREFLIFAALQAPSNSANSIQGLFKGMTNLHLAIIQKKLGQPPAFAAPTSEDDILPRWLDIKLEDFEKMEGAQHSHLDKAWNSFETEHQVDLGLSLHNLRAALAAGKINTVDFARPTGQEEPPITAKTGAEWKTAWENIIVFSGADDAQKETAKDAFFAEDAADLRYEFLSLVTAKRTYEILGQDQSLQSAEHKDLSQWVEKGADAYMDMLTGSPVEMGLAVVMAFFAIRGLFGGGGKIGSAVKWAVLGLGAAKLYENTTGENIFEQTGLAGGAEKLKSATTMAVTLNKADRAIANGYQPGELEKGYLDTATNRYAIADAMANDTLGDLVDWEKTHSMAGTQTAADMAKNMPDGLKDLSQPAEDHTRAIMGLGFLRVVYATTAGEENRYNIDKGRELFQRRAQQIAEASTSNGYADWKDVPLKEVLRSQHTLQDYQNSIDENRGVLDYSAEVLDWAESFLEKTGDTIFKGKIGAMTWLNNMRQTYGQAMIDNMKQWTVAGMEGAKDAWRFIKLKHEGMEVTIHQGAELAKFAITAPFYMGVEGTKWVIDATHENAPAVLAKLRAEWERNLLPEVEGLWNVTTNAFNLEGVNTSGKLFEGTSNSADRANKLFALFGIDANGNVINGASEGSRDLRVAMMHSYDFINTRQLANFLSVVSLDINTKKMIQEINIGKTAADKIDLDAQNANEAAKALTTDDIIKTLLRGGLLGTMASIMRGLQGATNASGEYIIKGVNLLFDDINETAMHIDAATGTWMDKSSFSSDILRKDAAGSITTLDEFFEANHADIQAAATRNGETPSSIHGRMQEVVLKMLKANQQASEQDILAAIFLKDEVKISDTESITLEQFFEKYADEIQEAADNLTVSVRNIQMKITNALKAKINAGAIATKDELLAAMQ